MLESHYIANPRSGACPSLWDRCRIVAKPLQHGAAGSRTRSEEPTKKGHLPLDAPGCNPLQMALFKKVPPLGLDESPSSSGNSNKPVATVANTLQLAAMLRDLDRSELEQLLLTLLSKAESASE